MSTEDKAREARAEAGAGQDGPREEGAVFVHGAPSETPSDPSAPGVVEFRGREVSTSTRFGRTVRMLGSEVIEQTLRDLEAMTEGLPVSSHPGLSLGLELLAAKVTRWRLLVKTLDKKGGRHTTSRDGILLAAKHEMDLWRSIEASLDALGLTPKSVAGMGFDLLRSKSLKERLAEQAKRKD